MVRFLHTGDWQLGMTRRFLSAEAQARFAAARIDALRSIGRVVAERDAAFVVVAGDVFESNHLDRQVVVRALEALAEVPVDVYLLPGNHDPLDAASVYRSPAFTGHVPPNVAVLRDAAPVAVAPGVELIGAPWASKRPLEDLVGLACADLESSGDMIRVLVGHGAVDRGAPDPDDPALIGLDALEDAVRRGCIQYVALGDRHSCTEIGGTGRVWYAGAPEPTDFDETDPGKVLVVDCDAGRCEVTAVQVGTWRFVRHHTDLAGSADLDELEAWLAGQPGKDRTVLRLSFVGTLPLRDAARLDALLADAADLFAAAGTWDNYSDLAVLPDDADFADLDLGGFARDTADELRTLASRAGRDAGTARGALALLYRLSAPGRGNGG
ncbi:MAG: DNA repair exonuclease [Euzebyales bacterium]|nr:DNA repair exonuclease [Euzebyales bacterium]